MGAANRETVVRILVVLGGGALLAAVLWLVAGCGGGAVELETARVAACQGAEASIEEAYDAGDLDITEASAAIDCARAVCDRLHEEIVGE
jgi:hypothetical protein